MEVLRHSNFRFPGQGTVHPFPTKDYKWVPTNHQNNQSAHGNGLAYHRGGVAIRTLLHRAIFRADLHGSTFSHVTSLRQAYDMS